MADKKKLITPNPEISINKQCELLALNRSSLYYEPKEIYSEDDLAIMNVMDEIYTKYPFYGYRRVHRELLNKGFNIGKDRVLKYKNILGLDTFYPKKRTSFTNKDHRVYPYLLKDLKIENPNQVWAADITYIRMYQGFCYLVAVMDWYSRLILSHEISLSMEVDFCIAALESALRNYKYPAIFNTDQGSQFTSIDFTKLLQSRNIKISMDGRGRFFDNIMIERFWRSIKYENIYLTEYRTVYELKKGVRDYINFYNNERLHSSFDYVTPRQVYEGEVCLDKN